MIDMPNNQGSRTPYRGGGVNGPKKTAKKTSKTKSKTVGSVSISKDSNNSMRIEAIDNGFLVIKSGYEGRGRNQKYVETKVFSPNNPVQIPAIKFGGKK